MKKRVVLLGLLIAGTICQIKGQTKPIDFEKVKKEIEAIHTKINTLVSTIPGAKEIIEQMKNLYKEYKAKKTPELLTLEKQIEEGFQKVCQKNLPKILELQKQSKDLFKISLASSPEKRKQLTFQRAQIGEKIVSLKEDSELKNLQNRYYELISKPDLQNVKAQILDLLLKLSELINSSSVQPDIQTKLRELDDKLDELIDNNCILRDWNTWHIERIEYYSK